MKNNKRYIKTGLLLLVGFLSITSFQACNKLDLSPTDSIDPSKAFRNLDDVNMGILGSYAVLDYTLIANNATVADEVMLPSENTVSNTDAHRWLYNASSGSVTSAFNEYYLAIDRANRVLAALENMVVAPAEQTLKDQYQGELLGIRGYSHLELLRAYASSYSAEALGVPYMKVAEIGYPARASFGEVMDQIKADLSQAKALISASYKEKSRITKTAVSAIQARAALYNKEWSDAVQYASEAIAATPLVSASEFHELWTDASNEGIIWELKRTGTSDSQIGGFFFRQSGSYVLYAPSFKLINSFDQDADVRFNSYIQYNPNRGEGKSAYLVNKYIGGDASNPGLADIKLFRTAEMYLIRAEALAESNQLSDAVKDLNALRKARITDYSDQAFTTKDTFIEAVYSERFKELAFEGHRFFDLKRRGLAVERLPEDAVNTSGAIRLSNDQAQYAFPIPAVEIQVNINMKQNPKY